MNRLLVVVIFFTLSVRAEGVMLPHESGHFQAPS